MYNNTSSRANNYGRIKESTDRQPHHTKSFDFPSCGPARSLPPNEQGPENGDAKQHGAARSSDPPGRRPRGRRRRRRGSPDEPVGHGRRGGRLEEPRAAVLLGEDDDHHALALLAAPGLAADEVERAGARERHGDLAGAGAGCLVGGERARGAAAVVVVAGHLEHRVRRVVVLEHCKNRGGDYLSIRGTGEEGEMLGGKSQSVGEAADLLTEAVPDLEPVDGGPEVEPVGLHGDLPPVAVPADDDVVLGLRARRRSQQHRRAEEESGP